MNPKTKNIRLYVKRVFISDDFDGELVHYLATYFGSILMYSLSKYGIINY
jgi:HSP90 family molecular chaperone